MKKIANVTIGVFVIVALVLAIIPTSRDEIHWQWTALRKEIKNYKSYVKSWPEGRHFVTALQELELLENNAWETAIKNNTIDLYKSYLTDFPDGDHVKKAKARIQIIEFNSAFKISERFTKEQVRTYMEKLESEFYSTVLEKPLVYYDIEGDCNDLKKKAVIVQPSPYQKACSLKLEAENLSITAIYLSNPSISRPLFREKWKSTICHNGCAGPGLEITLYVRDIKKFLDTYSIFYRVIHYTDGSGDFGYVIPDLVWGCDKGKGHLPHWGHRFKIKNENFRIDYKVDGVEGIPDATIASYKDALALKTYLKVLGDT